MYYVQKRSVPPPIPRIEHFVRHLLALNVVGNGRWPPDLVSESNDDWAEKGTQKRVIITMRILLHAVPIQLLNIKVLFDAISAETSAPRRITSLHGPMDIGVSNKQTNMAYHTTDGHCRGREVFDEPTTNTTHASYV
jgi:hypothetical protein